MVTSRVVEYLPLYARLVDDERVLEHFAMALQPGIDDALKAIELAETIFDPQACPPQWLHYMAQTVGLSNYGDHWLGVGLNPRWADWYKRDVIQRFSEYSSKKGTEWAIREAIDLWLLWSLAHDKNRLEIQLPLGDRLTRNPPKYWSYGTQFKSQDAKTFTERKEFGGLDQSRHVLTRGVRICGQRHRFNHPWINSRTIAPKEQYTADGSVMAQQRPRMNFYLAPAEWNVIFPNIQILNREIWNTFAGPYVYGWLSFVAPAIQITPDDALKDADIEIDPKTGKATVYRITSKPQYDGFRFGDRFTHQAKFPARIIRRVIDGTIAIKPGHRFGDLFASRFTRLKRSMFFRPRNSKTQFTILEAIPPQSRCRNRHRTWIKTEDRVECIEPVIRPGIQCIKSPEIDLSIEHGFGLSGSFPIETETFEIASLTEILLGDGALEPQSIIPFSIDTTQSTPMGSAAVEPFGTSFSFALQSFAAALFTISLSNLSKFSEFAGVTTLPIDIRDLVKSSRIQVYAMPAIGSVDGRNLSIAAQIQVLGGILSFQLLSRKPGQFILNPERFHRFGHSYKRPFKGPRMAVERRVVTFGASHAFGLLPPGSRIKVFGLHTYASLSGLDVVTPIFKQVALCNYIPFTRRRITKYIPKRVPDRSLSVFDVYPIFRELKTLKDWTLTFHGDCFYSLTPVTGFWAREERGKLIDRGLTPDPSTGRINLYLEFLMDNHKSIRIDTLALRHKGRIISAEPTTHHLNLPQGTCFGVRYVIPLRFPGDVATIHEDWIMRSTLPDLLAKMQQIQKTSPIEVEAQEIIEERITPIESIPEPVVPKPLNLQEMLANTQGSLQIIIDRLIQIQSETGGKIFAIPLTDPALQESDGLIKTTFEFSTGLGDHQFTITSFMTTQDPIEEIDRPRITLFGSDSIRCEFWGTEPIAPGSVQIWIAKGIALNS